MGHCMGILHGDITVTLHTDNGDTNGTRSGDNGDISVTPHGDMGALHEDMGISGTSMGHCKGSLGTMGTSL